MKDYKHSKKNKQRQPLDMQWQHNLNNDSILPSVSDPVFASVSDSMFSDVSLLWNKSQNPAQNPAQKPAQNLTKKQEHIEFPPPPSRSPSYNTWLSVGILEIQLLAACIACWLNDQWIAVVCILVLIIICATAPIYFSKDKNKELTHKTPLFTILEHV